MYDAVFVLVEAFNKLLRKKPDQFRSYTMRNRMGQPSAPVTNVTSTNTTATNNANANINRILDCNTSKGWVNTWEQGDKISRYLRKVNFDFVKCTPVPNTRNVFEFAKYNIAVQCMKALNELEFKIC